MITDTKNIFLNRVCAELRRYRPSEVNNFIFRVEYGNGEPYAILWFRTRGCKYDHRGECTMCNYGVSTPVLPLQMVDFVREALTSRELKNKTSGTLLISPSGSMFDEWEVPAEAREGIFKIVRDTPCTTFICETRVEDLLEDRVKRYVDILNNKVCCVEMGLESANPWTLKYCVNKSISLDQFSRSLILLRQHKVISISNILLGSAFLSVEEAIEDTVQSIRWAFAQGIDKCVVFPAHVKRWTLLEWLWTHDLYFPPSLWSLVEVLVRLGSEYAPRTTIAWYKVYYDELEGVETNIRRSPTTCPICYDKVINLLDVYSDTSDFTVVQQMYRFECECKDLWRAQLKSKHPIPIKERVAHAYAQVGRDVLGADWWEKHGLMVLEDIANSHFTDAPAPKPWPTESVRIEHNE